MKVIGKLAAVGCGAALAAALGTQAGGAAVPNAPRPGQWERVTATGLGNTADIGLVRGADGVLHVVWTSANSTSVLDTPIAANGTVKRTVTIVSHFFTVSFPDATATSHGLDVFWNAEKSSSSATWGTYEAARPLRGGSWHVFGPSPAVNNNWGSGIASATGADGRPWIVFVASGGIAVRHYNQPEVLLPLSGCCFYETGIGVDGRSGTTWGVWNSNASPKAGIYYRRLAQSGRGSGPAVRVPGSANTPVLLQRMTAVDRGKHRPGVYVTYLRFGSAFARSVNLYQLGAKSAVVVQKLPAINNIGLSMLAADQDGRIWVTWASTISGQAALFVRRSGTTARTFGKVGRVRLPAGTDDVWRVYASATPRHLDVVALLTVHGKIAYWHTQVLPPA